MYKQRKALDPSKSSLSFFQKRVLEDKKKKDRNRANKKAVIPGIESAREVSSLDTSPLPSIYEPTMPLSRLKKAVVVTAVSNNNNSDDNDDDMDSNDNTIVKRSPVIAYQVWHSPPEVYDAIYGFDADCEPPDRHNLKWNWLYKAWGYYSERKFFHRCCLYAFVKAQRRCARNEFWKIFELENSFRVQLQLLGLHMWLVKCRCLQFPMPKSVKLSRKMFQTMTEQLPNRFAKHIQGFVSFFFFFSLFLFFSLRM
ncbi:hypothetical protein RFI_18278 [Reticulomyxa filosa]|uniref:Ubiquinol-cytochrome c chaperone domain-containing protein n=1 Tax=Reticulomyxa filosa TaxID=46433 RepID=X6MZR6_RETFI|nr:hypothetical protein RFI_18278 [Reticulomyxa filosa]|eukprot:ETO18964.1 hypothetical protein RFI_18278 [Reticulomyxa filosa]